MAPICVSSNLTTPANGEVSEWFKEPVLKTGDSARGRGFEPHPLRHAGIAQWVELWFCTPDVVGSNPATSSIFEKVVMQMKDVDDMIFGDDYHTHSTK